MIILISKKKIFFFTNMQKNELYFITKATISVFVLQLVVAFVIHQ